MTEIERFLSVTKDTDDSYIESLYIKRPTLHSLAGEIEQLQHKFAIATGTLEKISKYIVHTNDGYSQEALIARGALEIIAKLGDLK